MTKHEAPTPDERRESAGVLLWRWYRSSDGQRFRELYLYRDEPEPRRIMALADAYRLPVEPGARVRVGGTSWSVRFPVRRVPGHEWGVAIWRADQSGLDRPVVRSACWTCSDAAGWVVSPVACLVSHPIDHERAAED